MKALVLDFDGVISDSAAEAFQVALRTHAQMHPDSRLLGLEPRTLEPGFLELMPLGNRAEDFGTALCILERGLEIADQAAYDAFRHGQGEQWPREFHQRFYRVRDHFAREDPAGWRRLLAPYPRFLEILRRNAGGVRLAIATAKDRGSVHKLLRAYGIDDLFDEELVLDKETGVSKTEHLRHLQRKLAVAYPDMTFVDDKVNHLDSVAPLGVRCALAAWGYNGPREIALARARGHLVCELDDVEAQLFG